MSINETDELIGENIALRRRVNLLEGCAERVYDALLSNLDNMSRHNQDALRPAATDLLAALANETTDKTHAAPQPARMPCPYCGIDHIDSGEWETRPHHKHLCLHCGKLFRFEGADGEYFYGVADPDHYP